jgi:demethylmenaquinone methyltransferase/2-methoxy-6-polyprenyl-1,4-benzoquinol methylase
MLGDAYRFYTRAVLPRIGGWISGDPVAYAYLPASVKRFFRPEELAAVFAKFGYTQVRYHLMTLGSVALHLGVRGE